VVVGLEGVEEEEEEEEDFDGFEPMRCECECRYEESLSYKYICSLSFD
jgi:hypothetical protein